MASDEQYRLWLIVPAIALVITAGILVSNFLSTGDWFIRSVELKGGTLISFQTLAPVDVAGLEATLEKEFGKVSSRELRGSSGYGVTLELEPTVDADAAAALVRQLVSPIGLSIQKTGPALGEAFWVQAQIGFVLAFLLMSIVVFIVYRVPVPPILVIVTAFSDIITTMAMMLVFHVELTLATFAALLMLIGYSVDTDILQTTRFLKSEGGSGSEVMKGSIKTGATMTMTTIAAMVAVVITSISPVITEIATVLLIGLVTDLIYTYSQNAILLRWYAEGKGVVA